MQTNPTPDALVERLLSMYSHRGDGIPTQYVNPDGPEAASTLVAMQERIERLEGALEPFADAADAAESFVGHDGPLDPMVPLEACRIARTALGEG